ncbi:hypothetical protein T265_07888 [Opisthorchis viverrini]|uniref:Uncharacterized protein n=1 Tax=Opisthorchis viverrini TaxID=6198 RepID=A0A074ZFP5_OPIVI|nr:hypothetical protein T265_07888 [Opisthorchis viverrini]KER24462.1 hypothetical protein T265_07888 [Opisthorchis viverrini]
MELAKYTHLQTILVLKTVEQYPANWNPAESLFWDVSRQLNVLHQAASCFSRYDIRDITRHAYICNVLLIRLLKIRRQPTTSSGELFGCWSVRRAWQLDCKRFITNRGDIVSALNTALTMSTRLVMKRLQSSCQARRTDQQPK